MDWMNVAHLLQAGLVAFCVVMFVMGFNSGNKL